MIIVAGLWATVSLLLRHWKPIEAHASKEELTEPLLQHQQGGEAGCSGAAVAVPGTPSTPGVAATAAERGSVTPSPPRPAARSPSQPAPPAPASPLAGVSPQQQLLALGATVWRQRSLPPLAQYNSLEPYQTFLSSAWTGEGSESVRRSLLNARLLCMPVTQHFAHTSLLPPTLMPCS